MRRSPILPIFWILPLTASALHAGPPPMPADPCPYPLSDELHSPSPAASELFGQAIALVGTELFVGEPLDDTFAEDAGIVHKFTLIEGAWVASGFLAPLKPTASQQFGASLATDLDQFPILVIGAPGDDEIALNAGAAYVFRPDFEGTWFEHSRLTAPLVGGGDFMGSSVAIDGDWIFVGAPFDDTFVSNAGATYVFQRGKEDSWSYQQQLLPSVAPNGAIFGAAVAIDGDHALVGAPYVGVSFIIGSVHSFILSGGAWAEDQRFFSPISVARDRFGSSIALRGDVAVIGAPRDAPPPVGLACIMHRQTSKAGGSSWTAGPYFFAPDYQLVDRFGSQVLWRGDRLLVAANSIDERGAVYLFDFDGARATFQCKISPDDNDLFVLFGSGLAMNDQMIMIGSSWDNDLADDAGSVSIFNLPQASPADLDGNGVVDGIDLGILLASWSIPPGTPGCGGRGADCPADVNGDGVVDGIDLGILLAAWTK